MADLPKLTKKDYMVLANLRSQFPQAFYTNATTFLLREMYDYIKDRRVWRNSIMGPTRGGKSEMGHTLCFTYVKYFNIQLEKGYFDDLDLFVNEKFKKEKIKYWIDFVLAFQTDYMSELRRYLKTGLLRFGQIWLIDEKKDKIGGIGSFSEELELKNINNIVAKFMQSEIWITPDQFQKRNAPYGIYCYKKDRVNRVNWGLLYKIEMTANSTTAYTFIGWVKIPLHTNDEFRDLYEEKKNVWIKSEIEGSSDKRMENRKGVALEISKDEEFSEGHFSDRGNYVFQLSKSQQISILEDWTLKGKTQKWNELEIFRIVDEARMNVMRRKKNE